MYVYIQTYMYAYIQTCMYINMFICMYVYVYSYIYICIYIYSYIHIYTYIHTYTYINVLHIYMYVDMYTYVHKHIIRDTYIHIFIYIHTAALQSEKNRPDASCAFSKQIHGRNPTNRHTCSFCKPEVIRIILLPCACSPFSYYLIPRQRKRTPQSPSLNLN